MSNSVKVLRSSVALLMIAACGLVTALPMTGSLKLQGSAIYSQLQLDYYFAELYAAGNSTRGGASSAQRMQVTVLATEWSQRSFNQYWSQAVSINNSSAAITANSGDLAKFKKIIQGDLRAGDQLVISRQAGTGTTITLNSIELLQTPNGSLFELLLNSWTGARPPSSQFKATIQGELPAAQLPQQFDRNSVPGVARIAVIRDWKNLAQAKRAKQSISQQASRSKPIAIAARATAESGVPQTHNLSVRDPELPLATVATAPAPKPVPVPVPVPVTGAKNKPAAASPIAALANPTASTPAADDITRSDWLEIDSPFNARIESPVVVAIATPIPQERIAAQVELTQTAEQQAVETPAPGLQTAGDDDKIENALLRIYRSNLLKLTYQNLIYPTGAINRNQEGKVVLQLTLNRQGKVKQVDFESESMYAALNRAAAKAVKEAEPFPAVPRKLGGKQVVVSLPINFVLSD